MIYRNPLSPPEPKWPSRETANLEGENNSLGRLKLRCSIERKKSHLLLGPTTTRKQKKKKKIENVVHFLFCCV